LASLRGAASAKASRERAPAEPHFQSFGETNDIVLLENLCERADEPGRLRHGMTTRHF
jgi:hypothetical protein